MVVLLRSLAATSRSNGARMTTASARPVSRTLRTTAWQLNDVPTGSESAVHAEKTDESPEQLQKKTANKAQQQRNSEHRASPNDDPTHSEDAVHADRHDHDPLPNEKKSKGKK